MAVFRIVYIQQTSTPGASQATSPSQQSREELRQQIKQTIQDARDAAQDAASEARDAAGAQTIVIGPNAPVPPGAHGRTIVLPSGMGNSDVIPPQAVDISIAFFVMCAVIVIGWPLARAFGKRLERRGEVAAVNPGIADQLQRIEQAVDAMAIEVERISESQRFMAKLQQGTGAAERAVALPQGDHR
jgi:hypothetical protein